MKKSRKFLLLSLPGIIIVILLIATIIPASACDNTCTLTPGYWKTHSIYGPAFYDSTWGGREDNIFYFSGKTNYQILSSPTKGNAYFIFAKQWIAANLNHLTGASSTAEVDAAIWDWGYNYFLTYTADTGNSGDIRSQAIYYADLLDQYNNGFIGPGHCE